MTKRALLASFHSGAELVSAALRLRATGAHLIDAYVPCEVEGLSEALSLERSRIPIAAFVAAVVGGGSAYLLQWYLNGFNYPIDVGGRPLHSAPAFIPITFEMAVLSASLVSFVLVLVRSGMPSLWHPLFEIDGFERTSVDRYWVAVAVLDPTVDEPRLREQLLSLGAEMVVTTEGAT